MFRYENDIYFHVLLYTTTQLKISLKGYKTSIKYNLICVGISKYEPEIAVRLYRYYKQKFKLIKRYAEKPSILKRIAIATFANYLFLFFICLFVVVVVAIF